MSTIRKSRFCFLIEENNEFLTYVSSTNSFYKINGYVADLIKKTNFELRNKEDISNKAEIESLRKLKILTTEEEDNNLVDILRMKFLMHSYAKECVGIIIVPTLSCNLRCSYCFEKNKKTGSMDNSICDKIIEFINYHSYAKYFALTWYGGEPLLCHETIEYLLSKIKDIKDKKLISHGMITNGTLLTSKNIDLFKEYPLDTIQITFDGIKSTHDTKRITVAGHGTFDKIIENLKLFINKSPNTKISIRVNIDKNNASEFMDVYKMIKEMFPEKKNIIIYPGILRACEKTDLNTPFLMNNDVAEIRRYFHQHGYPIEFPHTIETGCCATCLSSYIIGPIGEIYKCWEEVGIDNCVVGNVKDMKYTNIELLSKYMLHGSHILDEGCYKCPLLPVCSNDCARSRINNKFNGTTYDLCSIYKSHDFKALSTHLYDFYCKFVKKQQPITSL